LPGFLPDLGTTRALLARPDELFDRGAALAKDAGAGAFRMRIGYERWVVITDPGWQRDFAALDPEQADPFEFRLRMPALNVPGVRPPIDIVRSTRLSREVLARRCAIRAVVEQTDALVRVIDESLARVGTDGVVEDWFGTLLRCCVDMVSAVLLGSERARELPATLSSDYLAVERALSVRALIVPWLPSTAGRRARRASARIGAALLGLVASARARDEPGADGLVDELLRGELLDGSRVELDEVELGWMLNSIHWAAHRYPAVHAFWIGAQLHEEPELLARVVAEQASIPTLDEDGLARMEYLRGCVLESLRLHPLMALPRRIKQAIEIHGHRVEPGEVLTLSPYLAHHHGVELDQPARFWPERWASGAPPVPHAAFIPGGVGRWGCVGMQLTVRALTLLWARLLRGHELEFPAGLPAFRHGTIISPPARPVPARLRPRG
jgi:cytochrome P450